MEHSHYVIRGGLQGRERLRVLARVVRPTTIDLFERIGLQPGMACLDIGCGGGDVTVELARMVGPTGRVVGFDMDQDKIEMARREASELKLPWLEFRVLEIGQVDETAAFDVVYARFVLTHLRDPAGALVWMIRQLRPDGVAIVEDIDFSGHFCYPDSPSFRRYVELYSQVVQRTGADPYVGKRLPELLLDTGLQKVRMHVVQPAGFDGEVKLMAPLTMENIADSVLSHGLASRQEINRIVNDLYALADDHRTVMSLPRVVQVWGCRADDSVSN